MQRLFRARICIGINVGESSERASQTIDDPQSETIESPAHATAYDASAAALWGELFGPDQLAAHARDLATRHKRLPSRRQNEAPPKRSAWDAFLSSRRLPLLRRLNETETTIGAVRERLLSAVKKGTDVSPAGAWLLDNYFVVLEHARDSPERCRAFYRRLPKLGGGPHVGLPRAYDLAIELVAHTDGRLDANAVTRMLSEYQQVTPLTLAELWAMPAMLRMSLLENVRRMSLRVDRDMTDTEAADSWVARLRTQRGTELAASLSAFVRQPPDLTPAFLARFLPQLRANNADFTPLVWLEQWISDEGMSTDEAMRRSTQRLSLTQLIMANSITSLRMVAGFDWAPFVESMSATDAVLHVAIPLAFTDDDVRNARSVSSRRRRSCCTHRADRARRRTGRRGPCRAGGGGGNGDQRRSHVGYYLIASGRSELDAVVSYSPPASERGQRWVCQEPGLAYFQIPHGPFAHRARVLLWAIARDRGISVVDRRVCAIVIPATGSQ